ncbi:fructokinase [Tenacibaculum sp. MAR_2009_124]|uniref:carbohydrate kinase family protein n=1 Tax=Tenacibaculum sp. MAR_2009_124 TaxID=1250059 RepID=UPI00089D10D9|nr:carbohydrate kinase [Tenacibaculum sp. MAR_2009_124]SEC19188.1 fructokinase [Tenacibaculum sp. MAR_2009_124]
MSNIVCFGEVLWDVFPTYKRIGGAPLNVAIRLQSFNNEVTMVSSVGEDFEGNEIISFMKHEGLSLEYIQKSKFATGKVEVSLDDKGSASYVIVEDSAWDFIKFEERMETVVKNSDVFIFGSLINRNRVSHETLLKLLDIAPYKVLDVNLRSPYYDTLILKELLEQTNFLKINEEEYLELFQLLNIEITTIESDFKVLSRIYNLEAICMTKGEEGAVLYYKRNFYYSKTIKVEVVDTVGAGDSFVAALLDGLLKNKPPEQALRYACAIGALVASKPGANSKVSNEEIENSLELINAN